MTVFALPSCGDFFRYSRGSERVNNLDVLWSLNASWSFKGFRLSAELVALKFLTQSSIVFGSETGSCVLSWK